MTQPDNTSNLGFPRTPSPPAQGQPPASRPVPLPKRPKGRWFVGVLVLSALAFAGFQVYDSFFRYRAYGTVTGRVLALSAPWDGVLTHFHVREGECVRQGQILLTLENTELRHRHARLGDELRNTQASLEAEAARLKWQIAFQLDQSHSSVSRAHETEGRLKKAQKELEKLQVELQTAKQLLTRQAIGRLEVEKLRLDCEGQQAYVEKLRAALVDEQHKAEWTRILLVRGGELGETLMQDGQDQLRPYLSKIEALQAERARMQEQMDQGRLTAPSNGVVVKLLRFAGEHCRAAEPVLSLLEEGSLEVVLYVPQRNSGALTIGEEMSLVLDPYPDRLHATVTRYGSAYEPAPENLKRHYHAGQKLLPVYLQPQPEAARWMALRLNAVIKMP